MTLRDRYCFHRWGSKTLSNDCCYRISIKKVEHREQLKSERGSVCCNRKRDSKTNERLKEKDQRQGEKQCVRERDLKEVQRSTIDELLRALPLITS